MRRNNKKLLMIVILSAIMAFSLYFYFVRSKDQNLNKGENQNVGGVVISTSPPKDLKSEIKKEIDTISSEIERDKIFDIGDLKEDIDNFDSIDLSNI